MADSGVGAQYTLDSNGQAVQVGGYGGPAPPTGAGGDIPPSSPEGGLFGESLGAKVARGMLYVVPIVGQIAAGHERNVAAQRAQVNEMILTGALKSQDPSLLQHPEVMKATKALLGDKAPTFLGIASHIAQHQRDVHNGFIRLMLKHGYGQAGVDPKEVLRAAAAEATASGIPIPPEVGSLIEQHLMKPAIAAAEVEARRPGEVETTRQKAIVGTGARIATETSPGATAAQAESKSTIAGAETTAREQATQPFFEKRLAERIKAEEDTAKAREDRQNKERDLLYEKHRLEAFGDKRVPKVMLDNTVAFTQDGTRIELTGGTTFDQLDEIRNKGGTIHNKTWFDTIQQSLAGLAGGGSAGKDIGAAKPKQVDPVNDYLNTWGH